MTGKSSFARPLCLPDPTPTIARKRHEVNSRESQKGPLLGPCSRRPSSGLISSWPMFGNRHLTRSQRIDRDGANRVTLFRNNYFFD